MEEFLIKALQLILALALLVTVHEFGHYIFARMYGMRVNRFYLFFNPWFSLMKYYPDKGKLQFIAWTTRAKGADGKPAADGEEIPHALISLNVRKHAAFRRNGKPTWASTLYGIGWVPLGGYCSIAGMVDETSNADQLAKEPEEWEFRAKKPLPRLMVMLAGVIMNFVTAILIYIGIAWYWGERTIPYENATEGMDFIAQMHDIGIKNGDRILYVNGRHADSSDERQMWDMVQDGSVITVLRKSAADTFDTIAVTVPNGFLEKLAQVKEPIMTYRVPVIVAKPMAGEGAIAAGIESGDRIVSVDGRPTPSMTEFYPALNAASGKTVPMTVLRDGREKTVRCAVNDAGKIGIQLTAPQDIFEIKEVRYSLLDAVPHGIRNGTNTLVTYVSSLKLLFTKAGAQSIGGFGAIGDMFPAKWNWLTFWNMTAFLSVILAFMNILPIPALDGGHAMFTLWELVTRRRPSEKLLERAQIAGMAFLFLLLIYANLNDIYRFFLK